MSEPIPPSSYDLQTFHQRLKALPARVAQDGLILTEHQVRGLEKAKQEKEAHSEIETEHPGYLGSQDTCYVAILTEVGQIHQKTFIDTYSKLALVKLYDRKHAITATGMLNGRVLPFFEEHEVPLLYHSLEELQRDVDIWMESYNAERTHTGRYCYGKTPLKTSIDSAKLAYDRDLARIQPTSEPANAVMQSASPSDQVWVRTAKTTH